MMKEDETVKQFYKDFYGCTASIHTKESAPDYAELIIRNTYGKIILKKKYSSEKSAKIAMGKQGDCWRRTN